MGHDSIKFVDTARNGSFPPFSLIAGNFGNCIFRSFPPFFRAIRKLSSTPILLTALTLAGCATPAVRLAVPPGWQDHAAPVAAPAIPPATTPCAFDASAKCNTDAETGGVIAAYDDALAAANRKLKWFYDWFSAVPKPKP